MSIATARQFERTASFTSQYLPESDGKPMAETDDHRDLMLNCLDALAEFFRNDDQVYVSGNIFVYFRNENGEMQPVSPDILVVRGVVKKNRRIYNVEVEGKAPDLVIELTSKSTKLEDLGNKRFIYASLGVKEYFLFDPFAEAIKPALRGYRLENGDYLPMVGSRLHSEVLGLELRLEDDTLRLYDRKTGKHLLTREEAHAARRAAESNAAEAKAKAVEAEAKAAEARAKAAEAESKAAEAETKAAEAETKAAEAEARATDESAARQAAEAELARVREELRTITRNKS